MTGTSGAIGGADSVLALVQSIRQKGVELWLHAGNLHYRAPRDVLRDNEVQLIREHKAEIVKLLQGSTPGLTCGPASKSRLAPLAYSQIAYWNLHRLSSRRPLRPLASVTRLSGRLKIEMFRDAIQEVVRRHSALRTRIVVDNGQPKQEVLADWPCQLIEIDLTDLPCRLTEAEVDRLIEQTLLEEVDLSVGPLLEVKLLRLRPDEHVLIVAIEHMIADGTSLAILVREVFSAYCQLTKGIGVRWPSSALQFADYAIEQRNTHAEVIERYCRHLGPHFDWAERLRFPEDLPPTTSPHVGWGCIPLKIGADMKYAMLSWCRSRRTTLVMSLFVAYVALVLRWCDATEGVIQYQSNGRNRPDTTSGIGFFASVLYLRLRLTGRDSFNTLLQQVTSEYCTAYENADFSYFASRQPPPQFIRNPIFNWSPRGSTFDMSELAKSDDAIVCSQVPFEHPIIRGLELDSEPMLRLYDAEGDIAGEVFYPMNRFSARLIARFAQSYLEFLGVLVRAPDTQIFDIDVTR